MITFHEGFEMGTRVQVDETVTPGGVTGVIAGKSFELDGVFSTYIVLLDASLLVKDEVWGALSVPGTLLKRIEL